MDFSYPLTANPFALVLAFVGALILSHAVLLPLLGFNELRWHALDYLWLPMVLLGVLAAAQQNRVEISTAFRGAWEHQLRGSIAEANRLLNYHTSDRTYLCKKATRSEYSPPPHIFDQMEKDGVKTCKWFRDLQQFLPKAVESIPKDFSLERVPQPPKLSGYSGSGPEDAIENMQSSLRDVVQALAEIRTHTAEKESPFVVQLAKYYGPLLVCFALAIRITKVTGEARIKRRKLANAG
jgi:hypothetical protein